jgi:hypothetical protein
VRRRVRQDATACNLRASLPPLWSALPNEIEKREGSKAKDTAEPAGSHSGHRGTNVWRTGEEIAHQDRRASAEELAVADEIRGTYRGRFLDEHAHAPIGTLANQTKMARWGCCDDGGVVTRLKRIVK